HRGVREGFRPAGPRSHGRGDRALRAQCRLRGRAKSVHGETEAPFSGQMKIRAIRVRAVSAPIRRPLVTSVGTVSSAALLLIDLQTDDGTLGRPYLSGAGKHNLPPIAKLVEAMAEMVKGDELSPFDLERKLRAKYAL